MDLPLVRLLRCLLDPDPKRRCTIKDIMADPWFQVNLPTGSLGLNSLFPRTSYQHVKQAPEVVQQMVQVALGVTGELSQDSRSEAQQHVLRQTHGAGRMLSPLPSQNGEATDVLERELHEIVQRHRTTRSLRQELEGKQLLGQSSLIMQRLTQLELDLAREVTELLQLQLQRQHDQSSSAGKGPSTLQDAVGLDHTRLQQQLRGPASELLSASAPDYDWKSFLTDIMVRIINP